LILPAAPLQAQGLLIEQDHHRLPRPWPMPVPRPEPVTEYQIRELLIDASLKDQVAQVQVSQTFVNTGSRQIETQFLFPLPYDGAVDSLILMVDGKEFPAQLLTKEAARARYEAIVRASKDPALLEWMGRGMFQTSVFPVPPGQSRTVTLHYNQLLRKDQGVTDFLFPLSTARYSSKPVEKLRIAVRIESTLNIRNVYSPTHAIKVEQPDKKGARVVWEAANDIPASDFRLFFDVNSKKLGTSVLSYRPSDSEDGYFLLMTTPQIPEQNEQLAKTVVFVVDKSGSMSGVKIQQARNAVKFVLNNLQEGDLFNIIAYDSTVQSFRPELENFNEENRKAATGFVEGLYAGGGTNIHDSVSAALSQLADNSRPNFLIFLTDGLPTVGETDEARLAAMAREKNRVRARVLSFGIGYDVNSRLLDRLARDGFGASEYVRPDEDIEAHVAKVYSRIASPVLSDVKLTFELDGRGVEQGPVVNRVYPSAAFDLFAGEQVVVLGRYKHAGAAKVVLRGDAGREEIQYDFPASLTEKSHDQTFAFVEKLWAMRRIGEIIDELDLKGRNEELVGELVTLSTKHGILTPYTSFLADEQSRPTTLTNSDAFSSNTLDTGVKLRALSESSGRSGVSQRTSKEQLRAAGGAMGSGGSMGFGMAPSAGGRGGLSSGGGLQSGFGGAYRDEKTDEMVVVSSLRQVGNTTLYKRNNILCTSETSNLLNKANDAIDLPKFRDQITTIARFSPEYFDLCAANSPEENQLLAAQQEGEELLITIRGRTYHIQ
jgi:Ca-activated chloride channel family protein